MNINPAKIPEYQKEYAANAFYKAAQKAFKDKEFNDEFLQWQAAGGANRYGRPEDNEGEVMEVMA